MSICDEARGPRGTAVGSVAHVGKLAGTGEVKEVWQWPRSGRGHDLKDSVPVHKRWVDDSFFAYLLFLHELFKILTSTQSVKHYYY